MKQRRHTPEQVIRKLAEADKLLAQGKTIEEVCSAPRDLRTDLPSLAQPIRRDEGRRRQAAQGTREGEPAAEEVRGRTKRSTSTCLRSWLRTLL